ncbi:MAG: helix-turn-helix domain-containing protein [Lentisphaeria bacterium]|nr:helix-turn-helix domain-containing protein [Lentisphaeria bacterium]
MQKPKPTEMLFRNWLNLRRHILWSYDRPVLAGLAEVPVYKSGKYTNSGAWLVRKGWAKVDYGDCVLRAEPGQWLIVKPGQRIQSFRGDTHLLSVSFETVWPDGTPWLEKGLPLVVNADEYPALERKAKPMARIMTKISPLKFNVRECVFDCHAFLRLDNAFGKWLEILVDVLAEHGVSPHGRYSIDERVVEAVRLIDAHPLDEPFDQDALASKVGISLRQLTRLFINDLKTTPVGYYDRKRLEEAGHRLQITGVSVKAVAVSLGFEYLSHFSKWFKKGTGLSPRTYVKEARWW